MSEDEEDGESDDQNEGLAASAQKDAKSDHVGASGPQGPKPKQRRTVAPRKTRSQPMDDLEPEDAPESGPEDRPESGSRSQDLVRDLLESQERAARRQSETDRRSQKQQYDLMMKMADGMGQRGPTAGPGANPPNQPALGCAATVGGGTAAHVPQ